MGCCQSKWKRHEQPTDKIERFSKEEQVVTEKDDEKFNDFSKIIAKGKGRHSNKKERVQKHMPLGQGQASKFYQVSLGQDKVIKNKSQRRPIMVQVIEPSVTHSDFIHQLEAKESVPAQIFANMNNLDDCFKNSQLESRA